MTTCCIVIAAAQQFHAKTPEGFAVVESRVVAPDHFSESYEKLFTARELATKCTEYQGAGNISLEEQQFAAVLVRRDTFDLASSLRQLFADEKGQGGKIFSNVIFGLGVVGMTLSSISLMMLISGFVVCEVFDRSPQGWLFRIGCLVSATGVLWPLVWEGDARAWLTIIAGVFGAMLLPIAYVTFFIMMNSRSLMGEEAPTGVSRWVWNTLMAIAAVAATAAGLFAVAKRTGGYGFVAVGLYLALLFAVQMKMREKNTIRSPEDETSRPDFMHCSEQ